MAKRRKLRGLGFLGRRNTDPRARLSKPGQRVSVRRLARRTASTRDRNQTLRPVRRAALPRSSSFNLSAIAGPTNFCGFDGGLNPPRLLALGDALLRGVEGGQQRIGLGEPILEERLAEERGFAASPQPNECGRGARAVRTSV